LPQNKDLFLGPLDRVLYLRTLPMLDGLAPGLLAAIAQNATERSFRAGEQLFDVTRPPTKCYVVIEGRVRSAGASGLTSRDGTIGSGDIVGFLDLLARSPKAPDATADVDTLTLELDWDAHLDVCEDHFAIPLQYLRYLAKRSIDRQSILWPVDRTPAEGASPHPFARSLNFVERVMALGSAREFASCSVDAMAELARHVSELRLTPGEVVWSYGEPARYFLLLRLGALRCAKAGRSVREESISLVGLYEALCEESRWYDAIAEDDTLALRIEAEPFLDILEDHFAMVLDLASAMAQELLATTPPLTPTGSGGPLASGWEA
jgi:CRP-like cAMP-binding protein